MKPKTSLSVLLFSSVISFLPAAVPAGASVTLSVALFNAAGLAAVPAGAAKAKAGGTFDKIQFPKSKPPQETIPLEELARSRRVDLQKIIPPQDRMKDYGGPPKQCEVEIRPDIEYGQTAGESLRLDLYLPKGLSGARPGIVLIHGGGWRDRMGSRYSTAPQAKWFSSRGFVAASVEYRLAPRHQWPAMLDDCQRAIRWLRAHAQEYGLDPNRLASSGGSAGGHLSAMVALVDTRDNSDPVLAAYSSRVNLALPQAMPVGLITEDGDPRSGLMDVYAQELFGVPLVKVPKKTMDGFNLLPRVSRQSAPFFITHSKNDRLVPGDQPRSLCQALQKAGVDVELDFVDGSGPGHALVLSPAEATRHDNLLWAFVKKHWRIP